MVRLHLGPLLFSFEKGKETELYVLFCTGNAVDTRIYKVNGLYSPDCRYLSGDYPMAER